MKPITGFVRVETAHAHIKPRQFLDALSAVWRRPKGEGAPRFPKLALAVSGGVDSMALAILCRRMNMAFPKSAVKWRAFVVDHAARYGSDIEASHVAKMVKNLGIRSHVLTLKWPADVEPLELPDFESQARKLRYQTLGKACKGYGIQSLLLAHHADDQAETVLMRLADGHKGQGLQGVKPFGEIPECWGMHGVHLSGAMEGRQIRGIGEADASTNWQAQDRWMGGDDQETELGVEYGGIKIYRPLLGFSKNQLIATCQVTKTRWVEDDTNNDITLTPRNTVRHLLQESSLPPALRKSSLLAVSEKMSRRAEYNAMRVEELFRSCEIINFYTRSGNIIIRLPTRVMDRPSDDPAMLDRKTNRGKYIAAGLLRRVLELVTPLESVHLRDLEFAVKIIFPDLEASTPGTPQEDTRLASFTVAGVHCRRIHLPNVHSGRPPSSGSHLDPTYAWGMSRQPYSISLDLPRSTFPPAPQWSQWTLFDGRFWIRLLNKSSKPVVVRPMREDDLKPFRTSLSPQDRARFDELLDVTAPGKIRWTLPVLARDDGKMLAAVTLGVGLEEVEDEVRWMVRYKNVELWERGARRGSR